jgi:FkbM family methyltransferase
MASRQIIYDFGANNGDDVAYYLLKADLVVAVEANPALANQIRARFADEVANGRLFIENCVLTVDPGSDRVPFYVHKSNHVLSQFPPPEQARAHEFEEIELPSENVVSLIEKYGEPFYIKIDVEHYDQVILEHLFANGVMPPYISAESHSADVLAMLIALGKYEAFKLVDGRSVPVKYKNAQIKTRDGVHTHSFPEHSAGPFGEDIAGPWMTRNNFFRLLSFAGLGWKDIHASRIDQADPAHAPRPHFTVNINF